MSKQQLGILTLACAWVAGCSIMTEPEGDNVLGVIVGYENNDPQVSMPGSARVGEPFTVTVRTYGSPPCVTAGTTEVELDGLELSIRPMDVRSTSEHCPDILALFEHSSEITVHTPGKLEVVIIGRSSPILPVPESTDHGERRYSFSIPIME